MKKVSIVGLGFVGLPLARQATKAGYSVTGVDTKEELVAYLKDNEPLIPEVSTDYAGIRSADTIVICVPTPINRDKSPDLSYINNALEETGKYLSPGQLLIVESTVFPGYCETTAVNILSKATQLVAGKDFYLAHCPERINPGDKKWNVANIPRVLGAINQESLARAKDFYSNITSGEIHTTRNMAEAEAAKMVENSFRDINIAFVNELARSFDGTNVDVMRVINAAATKPFGYMPFYPGLGVGGHCIPVDPEYLISSARARGFEHTLLMNARKINDGMVEYAVDKICRATDGKKIALLGLTYKAGVKDLRQSQAIRLRDELIAHGFEVTTYDPLVESDARGIVESLEGVDTVIVTIAHAEFKDLEFELNRHKGISLVFDASGLIQPEKLEHAGYMGIGRS